VLALPTLFLLALLADPDAGPPPPATPPEAASAAGSPAPGAADEDADESPLERTTGAEAKPRTLAEIKQSGYLRILTRNTATSFFIYRGHRMGFDYELGKRLAQQLGIRALFVVPKNWDDIIPALLRGEGDVIAGQMTVTPDRAKQVLFAKPYLVTREVAVWKKGAKPIAAREDLSGKKVKVRRSSSYWASLEGLNGELEKAGKPKLELTAAPEDEETEEILDEITHGKVAYSVADELIARQTAAYYTALQLGAVISDERQLAWAVRPGEDTLLAEIDKLMRTEKKGPEFNILKKKYFEADREFRKRGKETLDGTGSLSPYDPLIQAVAKKYGHDWRLVAAQVYQESRFDPTRTSWSGAQGLFQLMPATAKEVGVKDPFDPKQSLDGGAKYMARIMKHFEEVPDPIERYKLALAAYNCGPGHVDDARSILKSRGKPAEKWDDVKGAMLELSREKVHSQTKYGFCRCTEPVDYVRHIVERYDAYRQLVPEEPVKPEPKTKAAPKPKTEKG
jgi:membrane-bound lytic murein transglycosylase F